MEQNLLQPKNHKTSSSDLLQNNARRIARRFLQIWEENVIMQLQGVCTSMSKWKDVRINKALIDMFLIAPLITILLSIVRVY